MIMIIMIIKKRTKIIERNNKTTKRRGRRKGRGRGREQQIDLIIIYLIYNILYL